MSSSTSSFRTELKVVALVLLVLAGSELFVRLRESALSLDVQHIRRIPSIAEELMSGEGKRLLFLGNSMTRNGVDVSIVEEELRAQGLTAPLRIERVYPDATGLAEWYYAFNHYFVDAGRQPDVLIIGFAANDLSDNRAPQPSRLAQYYTGARDVPEVFAHDVKDFEARAEFLLSKLSASFANRTRIRERTLDLFVPYYRESAQEINRAQQAMKKKGGTLVAVLTYERLERLGRLAASQGVRVILVAMPQREPYQLDPQLQPTIERTGMIFIDAHTSPGLSSTAFVDEMHLSTDGAAVYSRHLARLLASPLRDIFAQPRPTETVNP
jgi:lysophospholipase L1-like esterase